MTTELVKNQKINRLLQDDNVLKPKTVNLQSQGLKDVSFLKKMMNDEEMSEICNLNLSKNALDDSCAEQIADMLTDSDKNSNIQKYITKLDLSHNSIT